MTDALKKIWEKVDKMFGPQRMETEAEHIARDIREGNFPKRSDRIQVPVNPPAPAMTDKIDAAGIVAALVKPLTFFARWDHDIDEEEHFALSSNGDVLCQFTESAGFYRFDQDGEGYPTLEAAQSAFEELNRARIAAALDMGPIVALVGAATPYVSLVQNADYGRQLRQHDALVAALAAFRSAASVGEGE